MYRELEVITASYKTQRVKVKNEEGKEAWLNVDPFFNLKDLRFGQKYVLNLEGNTIKGVKPNV